MSSVARWLAPSLVATAIAAGVAGIADSAAYVDGALRVLVAAGFAFVLGAPFVLGASLLVRAALATWRPRALVAALTDEGGAAPRLAGWIVAIVVALALVALAANQSVVLLSRVTAWKARTVSVVLPVLMVTAVAAIGFVTVPLAVGLGRLFGRRARAFTARRVLWGAAAFAAVLALAAWMTFVRPLVRGYTLDGLMFTVVAGAAALAVHALWRRSAPRVLGAVAAGLAVVLLATTAWARLSQPTMLLGLWGGGGFGGFAIDTMVDERAVRRAMPPSAYRPVRVPGAPSRDIIVLTIDTFRPDRLAIHGGPVVTPGLSMLALRGAVFEMALSPGNVTRRSLPALATGVAATRVRGRVAGWALRLDPRHITVAERLRAGGYDTIGLFCCEGFWSKTRPSGLEAGFTDVVIERDAAKLVAALRERLAARRPDAPPLYVWMHFIEMHDWAGGFADLRPERRRVYDEALRRMDAPVMEMVKALAALPAARQPVVFVTGDHSEALGDHGQPFHAGDLYNSQIHVPLIVSGPGVVASRVREAVSVLDLPPTILELAGFVAPAHPYFDGRSLVDLLTGARPSDVNRGRAYAAMVADRRSPTSALALVVGRWKLIRTAGRRDELYDITADPGELVDRADSAPAELRAMQEALDEQLRRDRAPPFLR